MYITYVCSVVHDSVIIFGDEVYLAKKTIMCTTGTRRPP